MKKNLENLNLTEDIENENRIKGTEKETSEVIKVAEKNIGDIEKNPLLGGMLLEEILEGWDTPKIEEIELQQSENPTEELDALPKEEQIGAVETKTSELGNKSKTGWFSKLWRGAILGGAVTMSSAGLESTADAQSARKPAESRKIGRLESKETKLTIESGREKLTAELKGHKDDFQKSIKKIEEKFNNQSHNEKEKNKFNVKINEVNLRFETNLIREEFYANNLFEQGKNNPSYQRQVIYLLKNRAQFIAGLRRTLPLWTERVLLEIEGRRFQDFSNDDKTEKKKL